MYRWHDGTFFIKDVGEYTITFESVRGDGVYGDIAVDDISLKVKEVATLPLGLNYHPLHTYVFTVFSGTLTCVHRRVYSKKKLLISWKSYSKCLFVCFDVTKKCFCFHSKIIR